ncbi:MAG: hypothetical protein EAZ57_02365 [Cytophagales bacterium]|nr:MAG: hypothetical protein EAZ67_02220 [Cytophagales bacterium]TAF61961.1 MAG: hypothetical protein EAZ57_02365 [Cytophagales bacterium]
MLVFLSSFCLVLFLLLLSWLVGFWLAQVLFKQDTEFQFLSFRDISLGVTALLTALALVVTGGKTVFIGFLLIFLGFFAESYLTSSPKSMYNPLAKWRKLWAEDWYNSLFALASICFFITGYFYVMRHTEGRLINIYSDYSFYAKLSWGIKHFGVENYFHSLNGLSPIYQQAATEYHYYELWLNILFGYLLPQPHLHLFFNATFPFLLSLILFGAGECLGQEYKRWWWRFLFMLALMLFGGFFHELYGELLPFMKRYWLHFYPARNITEKQIPVLLFFLLCLLAIKKGKEQEATLWALSAAVATYTALPVVAAGVFFYVFVGAILRFHGWQSVLKSLTYLFFLALFLVLFYKLQPSMPFSEKAVNTNFQLSNLLSVESLLQRIKFIIGTSLRLLVLYFPLALVAVIYWFVHKQKALKEYKVEVLSLGFLLGGLVASALFIDTLNSLQLIYYPVGGVFVAWAMLMLGELNVLAPKKWPHLIALLSVIACSLLNLAEELKSRQAHLSIDGARDNLFISELENLLAQKKLSYYGGAVRNHSRYPSSYEKPVNVYVVGGDLQNFTDEVVTISISDLEVPISSDPVLKPQEESYVQNGAFYQFCKALKSKNQFESIKASQLAFCKAYKMNFVVVEQGAKLPSSLTPFVVRSLENRSSSYTLYLLEL